MTRRDETEIMESWTGEADAPLVTVVAICYCHEQYIRTALDSVLAQETSFPFEVIVHDDASPDGSADIIREYAAEYPRIIRPILESENQFSKGMKTFSQAILPHIKGKYVAYLDCDDYWTDPHKLQEQVDFLEAHPAFLAVTHNCTVVDKDGNPTGEQYPECKDAEYTREHFLHNILAGQMDTYVVRNFLTIHPEDNCLLATMPAGPFDRALNLTMLYSGRVYCIQKSMSAYRHITSGGMSYSATYRFDMKREALFYRALMLYCKRMGGIGDAIGMQRWFIDFLNMIVKRGDLTQEQAAPYIDIYRNSISCLSDRLARKKKRCPCCGQTVEYAPLPIETEEELVSHGCLFYPETLNPDAWRCPNCGSIDRERLAVSLLERLEPDKKGSGYRILQVAPSPALDRWLRMHCPNVVYETCEAQELQNAADRRYDLILCLHVLEHVRDDRKALAEMKRILKDDGSILFLVPIDLGFEGVDEAWGLSEEENLRRLGGRERCRRYGRAGMLARVGEEFSVLPLGKDFFGESVFRQAGLTDSSTLYLLCRPEQAEKTAGVIAALQSAERETDAGASLYEPAGLAVMTVYARGAEDEAFSEEKSARTRVTLREDYFGTVPLDALEEIEQLRVDPMDCACFLSGVRVCLTRADGESLDAPIAWSNGLACAGGILFDTDDPQLLLEIPRGRYRAVTLSCRQVSGRASGIVPLVESAREYAEQARALCQTEAERETLTRELDETRALYDGLTRELDETRALYDARTRELDETRALYDARTRELDETRALYDARMRELDETRKLYDAQTVQLLAVTASFAEISNAALWKMTLPVRLTLDAIKEGLRRLKKALARMRERGSRAALEEQKQERNAEALPAEDEQSYFADRHSFQNAAPGAEEPQINEAWLAIQREQPLISVVIAAKALDEREGLLDRALTSLRRQLYQNIEVLLVAEESELARAGRLAERCAGTLEIRLVTAEEACSREAAWRAGACAARGELLAFLEQEETLTRNALAFVVEAYNEAAVRGWELFLLPDDISAEDGAPLGVDRKSAPGAVGGAEALLHFGVFRRERFQGDFAALEAWLLSLAPEQIFVCPWVGCHGTAVRDVWGESKARCIAFYLPQFHAIPENDAWWGEGFTEWVNVNKAKPLYPGHHQPRVPGELGYYDLSGPKGLEVQRKQIALAKEYGLSGFCYYCYWFDGGKRLLEMPLDRHLKDKSLDFPFCLCWANENWTRRWDGLNSEILMPQTYAEGWAEQFIRDMLPYLRDERYIRVNGAPYLLIYHLQDIPKPGEAIAVWRRIARENGIERLHISGVRRTLDAKELELADGMLDSLTDFPPHLVGSQPINHDGGERFGLDAEHVKDYRKACRYYIDLPKQSYPYFRTVMLEWDNTARKGRDAYVFEEFSFKAYGDWLYAAKRYALRQNRPGEDLVFINAWNEWAEGTYLEPDESSGRTALETTKQALERR